jgi:tRNA nucleotidyltransferase (CCA-adding enzyme)
MNIPNIAQNVIDNLKSNGYEAFLVGGCVRDSLMDRQPHDFDIVTSALPAEIKAANPSYRALDIGEAFGIVMLHSLSDSVEVATFRADEFDSTSDSRRPSAIKTVSTIDEDLARRDFTCNAMALDGAVLIDPFGGEIDIRNRELRFVGDPVTRIAEDHLRVLRAFRFMSQLGFTMERYTFSAVYEICQTRRALEGVSQERITTEFCKIVTGPNAFETIKLMAVCGILFEIIPQLEATRADHDSPWHTERMDPFGGEILSHVLHVFRCVCEDDFEVVENELAVRLAALFHDIGKPACRVKKPDGHSGFTGHDIVGATMTAEIMKSMKFDNKTIDAVTALVKKHMRVHDIIKMRKLPGVRRLLGRVDIDLLLKLGRADEKASVSDIPREGDLMTKVAEWRAKFPVMLPQPKVTGDVLIDLGFIPGPEFGEIIKKAYNAQLTDESLMIAQLIKRATC